MSGKLTDKGKDHPRIRLMVSDRDILSSSGVTPLGSPANGPFSSAREQVQAPKPQEISRFRPPLIAARVSLLVGLLLSFFPLIASPGAAQETSATPGADSKPPPIQWTKIQDLNPNAPPTNTLIRQKWAVVVGIGKYRERRLNGPVKADEAASAFAQYLVDPAAGRFDAKHVKTLLNDEATEQNIMACVGPSYLGRLVGPDDLVVLFIATSGFPTTDGNAYLCTYNCALDNVYSTCLSMRTLMDTIRQNIHCNRVVLIVQAAYSGAAELESGAKALISSYNLDFERLNIGKGHVLISSSMPEQVSWGNVFATNFINALRDEQGLVPLERAFARARDTTERQTSSTPGYKRQTPVMKSDWKGHDLALGTPQIEKAAEIPGAVQNFLGAESHYLKANRLVEAGKMAEALAEYDAAVSADPRYADALADYGAVLSMQSDWTGAAQKYKQAIAVKPGDALFHANYARVLYRLGDRSECREELEKAYQINPRDRSVLLALSDRCLESREHDRAVALLTQAVELYPRVSVLHNRLSYALAQKGDTAQALVHATEAVKLDPQSLPARLNLGSVRLLSGDTESAISVYREADKLWPSNADVSLLLSKALELSGDQSGARAALQKYLDAGRDTDPRRQEVKQRLRELAAH